MLGVRPEGVTEAAGKLDELGVIRYARGHITVLERLKLEQLCCECYAGVRKESDRLLPRPPLQRDDICASGVPTLRAARASAANVNGPRL